MSTIQDTLFEIEQIQMEFESFNNRNSIVDELMNFTTVIYFEYLSHAILDKSRAIDLSKIPGSLKYYNLFSQPYLLSEYIRINNIGQFSFIWNAYEKYLRSKYQKDYNLTKFKIKDIFYDLINKIGIKDYSQIIEEFEVMRNTRNSLHEGGIYNSKFLPYKGKICGQDYIFTPGNLVTPLRIMDVVKTIWSHYKKLEKISYDD